MEPTAVVVADSISPLGIRLTTMEVVFHRYILPEFNTHRSFSRSGESSRAIPLRRPDRRGALDRVEDDPAFPLDWRCEQPGMQPGEPLEDEFLDDAKELFSDCWQYSRTAVARYVDAHPDPETRLHKSVLNRLLETYSWQRMVVTFTESENFFNQRAGVRTGLAQAEFSVLADKMLVALEGSTPTEIDYGEWHLPYTSFTETLLVDKPQLREMSAARCARASFGNHGSSDQIDKDLELFQKLKTATPPHPSPMEHQATPATKGEMEENNVPGNLHGWHQFRHEIAPHVWDLEVSND